MKMEQRKKIWLENMIKPKVKLLYKMHAVRRTQSDT